LAEVPALGARGEGWVVIQFALIAAVVAAALLGPAWTDSASGPVAALGVVVAATGGLLALMSAPALGSALTPFPRPSADAQVVERGPYRVVRHPIYAAGTLFCLGVSLVSSPLALVPTALLLVVWALKASVEERFLLELVPGYAGYMGRTRFRLVPFVF
jgi:protein-S-isoprenylcysteine O-methyltransferase Ste14